MFTRAQVLIVLLSAFALPASTLAQTRPEERAAGLRDDYEHPVSWQPGSDSGLQTFIGIRHNAADGTVVGMGLRPPGHPDLLLELEVVPPGHGPNENDKPKPNLTNPDDPGFRTVHKLSLRFRF